jgi:hypothetical protein
MANRLGLVHMSRNVATILVAILLSAPLVAGITPFPASFHTQMVPTNGTSGRLSPGGSVCCASSDENAGSDGTRTRGLLRDRQAF